MSSKEVSEVSVGRNQASAVVVEKGQRRPRRRAPARGRSVSDSVKATEVATKRGGLSLRAQVLLAIGLSVAAAGVAVALRGWIAQLGSWGYLGAFLINGISSATIFFPAPGAAIIMVMAQDYDPFLLGAAAGIGGALGSITSYIVGRLGARAVQRGRLYRLAYWAMRRFGGLILFIFTLIPFLPMDAAGLLAGATRYSVRRFYIYVGIASVIKMVALLYVVTMSLDWIGRWIEVWSGNLDAFSRFFGS